MADRMWIRHPETDARHEINADALPAYSRSGWQQMSADDVAAHEEVLAAAEAERVASLTPSSPREEPAVEEPAVQEPAARKSARTAPPAAGADKEK